MAIKQNNETDINYRTRLLNEAISKSNKQTRKSGKQETDSESKKRIDDVTSEILQSDSYKNPGLIKSNKGK